MSYMGFLGIAMVVVLLVLLLRGKTTPAIPFAIVPLVFGALASLQAEFGIMEIPGFAAAGVSKVANVAVLFIGTIMFFNIMGDAGMFDPMVNRLVRFADKGVTSIFMATALIAMVTHLDGAGTSTYLLTIPVMLPLYEKFKIRKLDLLLTTALMAGAMNLVPWGGPFVRVAAVLEQDPSVCWYQMLPAQIFGVLLALVIAFLLSRRAVRYGAGKNLESTVTAQDAIAGASDHALKRPKLVVVNWFITVCTLTLLFMGKIPSYLLFLVGTAVALAVNYKGTKEQNERVKAHASQAIAMVMVVISSGIFLGIFTGTGMVDAMVQLLIGIIPKALAPVLHIIIGLFAAPLGMFIGADPYTYGMLPIIMGVTNSIGIDPQSVAIAVVMGECAGWTISPAVSTVYLGIGLIDCELKDWLKYAVPVVWGFTVALLVFAVITGCVAI